MTEIENTPPWETHGEVMVRAWPDGSFDFIAGDRAEERLFMPQVIPGVVMTAEEAAAAYVRPLTAELRLQQVVAIKAEASVRILSVASLERQSNDNADIALLAWRNDLTPEETARLTEALTRRAEIDGLRERSNTLEIEACALEGAALEGFEPAAAAHWAAV